ncbi:hypothetical protein AMELA_G00039650 [Ameiurus melas]|uniref:Uncharacterized protein n=1 Tax=Ameiurus melas TaxID=219545 RepID=A0A7J6BC54_AMEME|nr:hypothetical protein AMELA_G00039650 [Ameiurus melas]
MHVLEVCMEAKTLFTTDLCTYFGFCSVPVQLLVEVRGSALKCYQLSAIKVRGGCRHRSRSLLINTNLKQTWSSHENRKRGMETKHRTTTNVST